MNIVTNINQTTNMLFNLIYYSCEYMKGFTDPIMNIDNYIMDNYGDTTVTIYNIIYAIILGTITFTSIYIVIPCISGFIIMCLCSFCIEMYEKISNTLILIKNIIYCITNETKLFIDGMIVTIIFIYYFHPFLFNC